MRPRSILTIFLLAVLLFAACTPAETATPVPLEAPVQAAPQETEPPAPTATTPSESQTNIIQTEAPTMGTPVQIPEVVATSRGPDLEATDPATVSLASGELQLVEFFRFT